MPMPKTNRNIAEIIKCARIEKGYTQAELSTLSNISLRSIQRIENGKVRPRIFTLKVLASQLDLGFENLNPTLPEPEAIKQTTRLLTRKWILSITSGLLIFLLAGAFLSQTERFPETNFEYLLFTALVISGYGTALLRIWR